MCKIILVATILLCGCATTNFEFDTTTKVIRGNTLTLIKEVKGFELIIHPDGSIAIRLQESTPNERAVETLATSLAGIVLKGGD